LSPGNGKRKRTVTADADGLAIRAVIRAVKPRTGLRLKEPKQKLAAEPADGSAATTGSFCFEWMIEGIDQERPKIGLLVRGSTIKTLLRPATDLAKNLMSQGAKTRTADC
jgi:hypothetical protein